MIRENLVSPLSTLRLFAVLAVTAVLAACSGGGAPTTQNPITTAPTVQDYKGPAPANADVQAFKLALWENIKATNRCGGCHNAGGQSPQFARNDDINLAYQAANTVVNLQQPDQSRMVVKVAGGHNCWLAAASACADTLTVWIRNWAGASASGGRQIQLQAPVLKDVGQSKAFPATSAEFKASLLWLDPGNPDMSKGVLRHYCAKCHASTATTPQSPFFASNDPDEAYAAVKPKINLDTPELSRLYVRLKEESHNCWTDCDTSAAVMLAAIKSFTDPIVVQPVNPALVTSKALTLYDGTVAAGGNRFDTNVVAMYEFKTGTGNIAYDTSGVEPALNLTMSGDVSWVGGWGINVKQGGKAQGSTTGSKKLADLIKSTGEYTIEAWVAPSNVAQQDAYIVSYSGGVMARNVTLGQHAFQYEVRARSSKTDANGAPVFITKDTDKDAQASLQHVVVTYDPVNGRHLYVNGKDTGDMDAQVGGTLAEWDDTFALVLGNETSTNRQWQGVLRLVAIHNRALTPAQIKQNFDVGVGERYFMLFSVAHLTNIPSTYLMFEASQLDSYAYQFTKPTFISLDANATIPSLHLKGVRLGVNGAEAKVGQAYIPLDATVDSSNYVKGTGQLLSMIGTTIALDKGPMADEFFLTFDQIGSTSSPVHSETELDPDLNNLPVRFTGDPQPTIGMRTFDELNATMSKITGIPTTNVKVAATFATVKQQLPAVESIDTFVSAQQTGAAQLAIQYCSALVDDTTGKRTAFFGPLDPSQNGTYITTNQNTLIDALINKAVGTNISNQAPAADVRNELQNLIGTLGGGSNAGTNGRAGVVMKAACGAVLGSGAILLQ
jgi:hypothetical protein